MASPKHTLPSSNISDVMSFLSEMKEDILTKLTCLEDDNRKLKQELHEIKSSQKNNDTASKKRDERDDEAEHKDENSNNKKARVSVSVASLPEPEPESGHILDPPASFNTLDDDCLDNVLDFLGKKSYSVFGLLNKSCHEIFCSKGLPKETYTGTGKEKFMKGVLHFNRMDLFDWMLGDENIKRDENLKYLCDAAIEESRLDIVREIFRRADEWQLECLRAPDHEDGQESYYEDEDGKEQVQILFDLCRKAAECGEFEINGCLCNNWTCYYLSGSVLDDNRKDIFEWMLASKKKGSYYILKCLCRNAIKESRLDILCEVFRIANGRQLRYLRDNWRSIYLCPAAAEYGKLECLKLLRENECGWNEKTWEKARKKGHEHILQYLRDNGYPTEWQVDIDSDSESE